MSEIPNLRKLILWLTRQQQRIQREHVAREFPLRDKELDDVLNYLQRRGLIENIAFVGGVVESFEIHPDTRSLITEQWDVFISAKSADYMSARHVFEFLRSQDINAFLSDESLPRLGNSDYRKEIDHALEQAHHMVVVTSSRENVESTWVEAEWGFFINEKRSGRKIGNLVTMLVGGRPPNQLPPSLRYYEALNLDERGLQKLVAYVCS
jgi:hypothetical protein